MAARFLIGIDLGTTNTVLSWLDAADETARPRVGELEQVIESGEREARGALPSFVYLPDPGELPAGALDLSWAGERDFAVGTFARRQGAKAPHKVISSAKSWLCVPNVDRLAPILPWNRRNPERQISPVEAARRILEHLRDGWNAALDHDPEARFEDQEVILTVPASFDAVARELTVRAASQAGLQVTLLEEPQAAFYAWLEDCGEAWREQVQPGERVLVCDIGGGTTDFSLIEVVDHEGNLELRRVAVGDHILLGGDNMDLTLAHVVAQRLRQEQGLRLDAYQLAGLTHACREAKETLCEDPAADPPRLTVLGRGSSLIGGTITTELRHEELQAALLEGFFPRCGLEASPAERQGGGLRAFGLNYAADPGITRHLAAFLRRHAEGPEGQTQLPGAVLFNGGVSKAPLLRDRIVQVLGDWTGGPVRVLTGAHPDLAVARGACWFGRVRRGDAIRIRAGSPQTYYVGIESTMPAVPGFAPPVEALCVVPFGLEEGSQVDVPYQGLGLVVGQDTEFRFFISSNRNTDQAGEILPDAHDPDLVELPPLHAELPPRDDQTPPGTLVPVQLRTVLNEIGTLQLWCHEEGGDGAWELRVDLRAQSGLGSGLELADETGEPEPDAAPPTS